MVRVLATVGKAGLLAKLGESERKNTFLPLFRFKKTDAITVFKWARDANTFSDYYFP